MFMYPYEATIKSNGPLSCECALRLTILLYAIFWTSATFGEKFHFFVYAIVTIQVARNVMLIILSTLKHALGYFNTLFSL